MNDSIPQPPLGQSAPVDRVSRLIDMEIEEYLEADAAQHRFERDPAVERGIKAVLLAPTIELCQALLRGERVPWWLLNFEQAERYGLRRRTRDDRYALADFNDVRK
jgi:hypothetical protein